MKKINYLALVMAIIVSISASGQSKLDSLLAELPNAQGDTNHVLLLTTLARNYAKINTEQGLFYGKTAFLLAEEINWGKGSALAEQMIGYNHSKAERIDTAIYYYSKSTEQAEALGLIEIEARNMYAIGVAFMDIQEYDKAIEKYTKALSMYQKMGKVKIMTSVLRKIAWVQLEMNHYNKALDAYEELEKLCEEEELPNKLVYAYSGLSDVYMDLSNHPKALEYALKTREIYEDLGDKAGVANEESSIGVIYQEQEYYNEALEHYNIALVLNKELEDYYSIALGLNNLGSVYHFMEDYDQALSYYELAFKQFELAEDPEGSALSIYNMGGIHKRKRSYKKAFEHYKRARDLFVEFGDLKKSAISDGEIGSVYLEIVNEEDPQLLKMFSIKSAQRALIIALNYTDSSVKLLRIENEIQNLRYYLEQKSTIEAALGDNKGALKSFKEYALLNDSIFNLEKDKKLVQAELQFAFAKREGQLEKQLEQDAILAEIEIKRQRTIRNYSLMGGASILFFAVVLFLQRNRVRKEKANVELEKARSEDLLLNILPEQVAEELKQKGHADAKLIDHVSVLFTDFKGFTAMAETLSPKELVEDLNVCFSAFDRIMTKYGIEKIKTIGDAYMAAGGLPTPNDTHAMDVIQATLEMRDFVEAGKAKKIKASLPYFEIRIGIHTGPVVAGIVGLKKFQYDIWGDTVNTASRMESSGEVGYVNISETTYKLVKENPDFTFENRGKIDAKGKGKMEMYFVSKA